MKKQLLTLSFALFAYVAVMAQCTPIVMSSPGIYPDSATNFPAAIQGQPYALTISVNVPPDTAGVDIAYISLDNVTGLPAGLSYVCAPANCQFPGGQTNCALISGTTNAPAGDYPLVVTISAYVQLLPSPAPPILGTTETLNYYHILVNPSTGTLSLEPSKFSLSEGIPNPSDNKCDVYYSLPSKSDMQVKLQNALGQEVWQSKVSGANGINKIEIPTAQLSEGFYFVSITNNEQKTLTKKIVVKH